MSEPLNLNDIRVNADNLYREEMITDLRVATMRQLIPIKPDGSRDEGREPIFIGQTHVMTSMGAVPIEAPLDAATLQEAMEKYPEAIREAIAKMVDEVREMQRQEASRIVVPKMGGPGKIQLG